MFIPRNTDSGFPHDRLAGCRCPLLGRTALRTFALILLVIFFAANQVHTLQGADPPSFEKAANLLQKTTVTVRVTTPARIQFPGEQEDEATEDNEQARTVPGVSVCSGVSLGGGFIVTYLTPTPGAVIRVTIPGGGQATTKVGVMDRFSGLTLLEIDDKKQPALAPAETLPKTGQWILSGAAWGAEKPVVSFGLLGGTERSLPGASFPPLLQCDIRTAETSSGAGLVNREGQLIGIIVVSEKKASQSGWTYAVPVQHVQRLLRAYKPNKTIVLKRRRPILGMVLSSGEQPGTVVVARVTKDSPAAKAGFEVGDAVLGTEGMAIRAVYQVVRPLLQKQPGDKMTFAVRKKDTPADSALQSMEVVLGGGIELPDVPQLADNATVSERRVHIQIGKVNFQRVPGEADPTAPKSNGTSAAATEQPSKGATDTQHRQQLEKTIEGYKVVLEQLQKELRQQRSTREQTLRLLQRMEEENRELKKKLLEKG